MYCSPNNLLDGHLEISGIPSQLKLFMDIIYKTSEDFRIMKFYMVLDDNVISMYPTNIQCHYSVIIAGVKHILLKCIELGIKCNGRFIQLNYPKPDLHIRVIDNMLDTYRGMENIYGRLLDLKIDYDRSIKNEVVQLAERMRCRRILRDLGILFEDAIHYVGEYI